MEADKRPDNPINAAQCLRAFGGIAVLQLQMIWKPGAIQVFSTSIDILPQDKIQEGRKLVVVFCVDRGRARLRTFHTGLRVGSRISMDGKGRGMDNIFIERLWRSLKYECVYVHAWETGSQARAGVGRWITF